jgi:hypothetical protein
MDAADIAWSPDSSKLAVWDSPLTYAVHVLGPDGASLGSYSAYGDGLGVRSVSWSPGGDLLAVGSYDQVREVWGVVWGCVCCCELSAFCTGIGPLMCVCGAELVGYIELLRLDGAGWAGSLGSYTPLQLMSASAVYDHVLCVTLPFNLAAAALCCCAGGACAEQRDVAAAAGVPPRQPSGGAC